MQLTWKTSESASAFYAAVGLADGWEFADQRLESAIEPIMKEFQRFTASGSDARALLALMAQLSAGGCESNHALAEQSLRKSFGEAAVSEGDVSRLAAWTGDLKTACLAERNVQPNELLLRGGPLREQWEARGPGMMKVITQLTEPWLVADQATVVLVQPAFGGHGVAHLPMNLVSFEAMLTNADDSLPEVVRLAWLLAQLQCDLPIVAEQVSPGRIERLALLATIPPVLAAAERVELAQPSDSILARAVRAWRTVETEQEAAELAEVLATWWEAYEAGAVNWPVAVAALDQMLDRS
ncbi:MAG: hypothetical protein ACR2NU_08680 [Aeoliella sp.]